MEAKPLKRIQVTSKFGPRIHPVTKVKSFHNGVDLRAAIGTPCYAIADGTVIISKVNNGGPSVGYGYYLVVEHDGFCTLYAHLNSLGLASGTNVKKGDVVAYTGNSGKSTGPHLHFEIREGQYHQDFFKATDGKFPGSVDPMSYHLPDELWKRIIRDEMSSPEEWIDFIEKQIRIGRDTGFITQYFPEFIVKLSRNSKK